MKNKRNQITLIYILISLVLAVVCFQVIPQYSSLDYFSLIILYKDFLFIFISGIILRFVLYPKVATNLNTI